MSKKYVIEIKPEYEDTTKGVMVIGAKESNIYVDTLSIENLEELNSDYINEHYGDLQDDAYNKGYAQCQDDYSDALKHAKDTAYKKGLHDGESKCGYCNEYQRGLDDAWKAAKKIVLDTNHGGIALSDLSKIFGGQSYTYIMNKNTAQEAIAKLKAYEEKQKAKDEIKVSDEVIDEDDKKFWVTKIHNGVAEGIMANGEVTCAYLNVTERTGRHNEKILELLDEMKE